MYVALDGRRSVARLAVRVEMVMVSLMLLAAVRARDQFLTSRPLTWLFATGFVVLLLASLWFERSLQPADAVVRRRLGPVPE